MAHSCNHCDWATAEPEQHVSGPLAAWHVYEDHPDVWRRVIGDRPPRDPDPRIPSVRAQVSGN
jgi:hypothetical protein